MLPIYDLDGRPIPPILLKLKPLTPKDRIVLMVLIDQLLTNGVSSISYSQRELGELAGIDRDPCHEALKHLRNYGFIEWERPCPANRYYMNRLPGWVKEKFPDEWKPLYDLINEIRDF